MEILLNYLPWIWLGVAVLCIITEALTFTLTTIWFAFGAVAMIFISLTHIPLKWQVLIFVVISLLLLIFTRPLAVRKLKVKKTPTNSDYIIGKKAVVTERITELEKGAVRINGVEWTAASKSGVVLEKGSECTITEIQGATAVVEPLKYSDGEEK
ncbi:MAG: NfeD family protein [Treponema sp.]|nr:NfeD family protein [Treponema sp.]